MKTGRNMSCPCGSGRKYKHCCLNNFTHSYREKENTVLSDQLKSFIEQGYIYGTEDSLFNAISIWLDAWRQIIKIIDELQITNIKDTDNWNRQGEFISNWLQDLEMELGNAGIENKGYYHKRIKFCDEVCDIFHESNPAYTFNFKRAKAESYFSLDLKEKGEECFMELEKEYPFNFWTYIGWGDAYMDVDDAKADYNKAKARFSKANATTEQEKSVKEDRLKDVEKKLASK